MGGNTVTRPPNYADFVVLTFDQFFAELCSSISRLHFPLPQNAHTEILIAIEGPTKLVRAFEEKLTKDDPWSGHIFKKNSRNHNNVNF